MRRAWTNHILHLSGFIYSKQQALLTEHGFKIVITVWQLIAAQLWLAIISLPLAIVAKPVIGKTNIAGVATYSVRRVLTLTVVTIIAILWLLKLGVVLFGVWQAEEFRIEHRGTRAEPETTAAYLTTRIAAAGEDPHLVAPVLREVNRSNSGVLTVTGSAKANTDILLYVIEAADGVASTKVYAGTTDNHGTFTITENEDRFSLRAGTYVVEAFAYSRETGLASSASTPMQIAVQDSLMTIFMTYADRILNITTAAVLGFGILLTILIL